MWGGSQPSLPPSACLLASFASCLTTPSPPSPIPPPFFHFPFFFPPSLCTLPIISPSCSPPTLSFLSLCFLPLSVLFLSIHYLYPTSHIPPFLKPFPSFPFPSFPYPLHLLLFLIRRLSPFSLFPLFLLLDPPFLSPADSSSSSFSLTTVAGRKQLSIHTELSHTVMLSLIKQLPNFKVNKKMEFYFGLYRRFMED